MLCVLSDAGCDIALLEPQGDFNTDWRSMEVGSFIDYLHACPPQPGVDLSLIHIW